MDREYLVSSGDLALYVNAESHVEAIKVAVARKLPHQNLAILIAVAQRGDSKEDVLYFPSSCYNSLKT